MARNRKTAWMRQTIPFLVAAWIGWSLVFTLPVQAATIPDFLLRPLALHYCQAKTAAFANPAQRQSLCICAWKQIARTRGERSAILSQIFHTSVSVSAPHWLSVERRQVWSCVVQDNLTQAFYRAEKKHPKIARWLKQP